MIATTAFDRAGLAAAACPTLRLVSLLCMRCEREFRTSTMSRECFLREKAARRVYGTAHPAMECGG